jgi:hypothetical protein
LRIDAVQFAGFDERSKRRPSSPPPDRGPRTAHFSIENNWAHASFDDIGGKLDATVVEETGEPSQWFKGRSARELLQEAYRQTRKDGAAGIDGVTAQAPAARRTRRRHKLEIAEKRSREVLSVTL